MKQNFKKYTENSMLEGKKYIICQCHLQDQMATFHFKGQNLGSTFLLHCGSLHAVSALQAE